MSEHKTVLLKEAIEALNLKKGDVVVDATLGGGGHSLEILKRISSTGKLLSIDRDEDAIKRFQQRITSKDFARNVILVKDNFSNLAAILQDKNIEKVKGILADFGLSSDQLNDKERGFSFYSKGTLDMRMDKNQKLTAKQVVNEYSEKKLADIFRKFGDEAYAKNIAKKIIKEREKNEIASTEELVEIIKTAVPEKSRQKKTHFATKVFQAIRIEVNSELLSIEKFLKQAIKSLQKGGRLAVISFHSGEDRLVKKFFREKERGCDCPPEFPICQCGKKPEIKIITKKPIVPSEDEVANNIRSRSAKMRVAEKI